MLAGTITFSGKSTDDLVFAIDEAKSKIEDGFFSGFDRNESGDFSFTVNEVVKDDDCYYIGELYIRNGEYEYRKKHLFSLNKRKSPDKYMRELAKTFYGDNRYQDDNPGYYFNGGEVYVEENGFKKVSKDEYKLLRDHL